MVRKKSKVAYVVGSIIIGIVAIGCIIAGLFLSGAIDARSVTLVFDSGSKEIVYNGETLTCDEWSILEGELKKGHEAKVTMTGKQDGVGASENTYTVVILDGNGADVTSDYELVCNTGILAVTARPITLRSNSETKIYDGEVLRSNGYEIVSGDVASSHVLECVVDGEITEAGKVDNILVATVRTMKGDDVTANYNITTVYGTLTVEKRNLTLQAESATKIYDGVSLVADAYEILDGTLPEGQTLNAVVTGTITNAGEVPNVVSATIVDAGGVDVTKNYDLTLIDGTLTIEKRSITVQADSDDKMYDGESLVLDSYKLMEGEIPQEHMLNCTVKGEILNVGVVENVISATVVNAYGEDVSYNFDIEKLNGTLTVYERPFAVVAASDSKEYDGYPLSKGTYEILEGEMPTGHYFVCNVIGERTNAGTTANVISVKIYNVYNEEVSFNFDIDARDGELVVRPRPITITTGSYQKVYDGEVLKGNVEDCFISSEKQLLYGHDYSITLAGELLDAGSITNYVSSIIITNGYEEVTSNYDISYIEGQIEIEKCPITVQGWSADKEYDGNPLTAEGFDILKGTLPANHYLSCVSSGEIVDAGVVENIVAAMIYNGADEDVTHNFLLTLYNGTLEVRPVPITITSGSMTQVYNGEVVEGDESDCTISSVRQLLSGHWLSVTLSGSIKNVGSVTNKILTATIYNEYQQDVTRNYEITLDQGTLTITPLSIVIQTGSAEKDYDGIELTSSEAEVIQGKEFIPFGEYVDCQTTGSLINVGRSANYCSTVVYNADGGISTNNYLITYEYGSLVVNARPITISSASDSKTYDGTALTAKIYNLTSGTIAPNQTLDCKVNGTITNAGYTYNYFDVNIYNEYGQNTTRNYSIEYQHGVLTVEPRTITIQAASYQKVYDGTALTGNAVDCLVSEENLLDGHKVSITLSGSIIDVGTTENVVASVIVRNGNTDVTSNYNVEAISGTLKVTPIQLSIQTDSAEKEYDGTPLTAPKMNVVYGEVLSMHRLEYATMGTITNVGETANTVLIVIYNENGAEVSRNYSITESLGQLKVTPIPITVQSASYQREYDGTPLTGLASDCQIVSIRTLLEGHSWGASVTGSQTDVGTSVNSIADVVITCGSEDVTRNYSITKIEGNLTITPRRISILSGSAVKNYDGTPLTYDYFEITSFNDVLEGHVLDVKITGTRTEIGESPNTISDVRIMAGKVEVTHNYIITKEIGSLIVKGNSGGGGVNMDDDSDLRGDNDQEPFAVARVYTNKSGTAYLRTKSEGNYNGKGWTKIDEYGKLLDGQYSMNYLTGIALENSKIGKSLMRIELLADVGYMLPYYLDNVEYCYTVQTSDTYHSGAIGFEYSMKYFPYNYVSQGKISSSKLGTYAAAELEYRNYVQNTYLTMPDMQITEYLQDLIREKGWTKSTSNIINLVANYIRSAARYNLEYDSAMDAEEDIVYAFLTKYKEGVCRHYASAGTLLYRALGIPARYTVGFMDSFPANEYKEIKSDRAHAWVEVYVNGVGWVQVEVTGSDSDSGDGEGGTKTQKYVVTAQSQSMLYSATNDTLYAKNTITLNADLENLIKQKEYTYEAVVSGVQNGVGKSEAVLESFTLFDKDNNDVTDQYYIERKNGTLHIYLYELKVVTKGAEKVYDGTSLENKEYTYSGLQSGHSINVSVFGSQQKVGVSTNKCSVKIFNAKGEDVSVEYKISSVLGVLRVTPREITIRSESATQVYNRNNPTELVCHKYSLVNSTLADNQYLDVEFKYSQTRIGQRDNEFSVVIYDKNDQDVTSNYTINYIYGKLIVTSD